MKHQVIGTFVENNVTVYQYEAILYSAYGGQGDDGADNECQIMTCKRKGKDVAWDEDLEQDILESAIAEIERAFGDKENCPAIYIQHKVEIYSSPMMKRVDPEVQAKERALNMEKMIERYEYAVIDRVIHIQLAKPNPIVDGVSGCTGGPSILYVNGLTVDGDDELPTLGVYVTEGTLCLGVELDQFGQEEKVEFSMDVDADARMVIAIGSALVSRVAMGQSR